MWNFQSWGILQEMFFISVFVLSENVTVMISWWQDFVFSNSVYNHTHDWHIVLPLCHHPILLITQMVADWIGLHLVLLPLLIIILYQCCTKLPDCVRNTYIIDADRTGKVLARCSQDQKISVFHACTWWKKRLVIY